LGAFSNTDSKSPISDQDIYFINRLAKKIHSTGFVTPCVFFLEMLRPFSSLGSHALVFMGPIITGFIQSDGYYKAAELLNNKTTLSILLDEIERLELLDSDDGMETEN
tara:strand:+ start:223 stop:546 length:324 start_codon:yes stop_codon:yes gene_type:complete